MSELHERRWAVVSERGGEQTDLNYEEAVRAVEQLRRERVAGLVVVSVEAARRLTETRAEEPQMSPRAPE